MHTYGSILFSQAGNNRGICTYQCIYSASTPDYIVGCNKYSRGSLL